MRFWDSSGVIALLVEEPRRSDFCRRLLRSDDRMAAWALTRTECLSGLERRRREGMPPPDHERARQRLDALAASWREVDDLVLVRGHAERFLRLHPLRAADALQLGAAWLHARGKPRRCELVAFDGLLLAAAEAEGFKVVSLR